MDLFTFLVITYSLIDSSKCLEETIEDAFGLQILPESLTNGQHIILKQVDETLNLYCRIQPNKLTSNKSIRNYKLSWKLPHLTHNSQNRVIENQNDDSDGWQLVIQNLKESDTGDYECLAQSTTAPGVVVKESVRVNVKNKKTRCGESDQMFTCSAHGNCIIRRYVCDGHRDCRDGADEDEAICGPNACEGKIHCPTENRCIPSEWCCDHYTDPNCTVKVKPSCCPLSTKRPGFYPPVPPDFPNSFTKFSDDDQQQRLHNDDHQRFSDMGFLQTTIYTVIGCAMAFMFIVTILVIAICRVHMKRTLLSRCPNARNARNNNVRGGRNAPHHHGVAHMPLYDLDVFLNRGSPFPSEMSPHSGLLVTYNINNGVQFVGRPVDPPPYCEIVASPPREGPPPPYVSHENLRAPQDARDGESGENASESDALLTRENRSGNTLRITVVNTAPRGDSSRGDSSTDGGRYRLVAIRTRTGDDGNQNDLNASSAGVTLRENIAVASEGVQNDLNLVQNPQNVVSNEPTSLNITLVGDGENAACEREASGNVLESVHCDNASRTEVPIVIVTDENASVAPHKPCNQAQLRKNFFGLGASESSTEPTDTTSTEDTAAK